MVWGSLMYHLYQYAISVWGLPIQFDEDGVIIRSFCYRKSCHTVVRFTFPADIFWFLQLSNCVSLFPADWKIPTSRTPLATNVKSLLSLDLFRLVEFPWMMVSGGGYLSYPHFVQFLSNEAGPLTFQGSQACNSPIAATFSAGFLRIPAYILPLSLDTPVIGSIATSNVSPLTSLWS